MPQAAKGRRRRAAALLLLALLAGAASAEASIPRPEASAELAAWPAPLPDAPALVDLELAPASPATTTAPPATSPATAAAAGDRFGLFDPGPGAGFFATGRPSARARLEAETRLRVHDFVLPVRVELAPLEVAERTGFTVFGRRGPRRGSENRWFDPELGRFISTDPLGYVDGPNLYQYAGNDPINFFDPLGLQQRNMQEVDWLASADPELVALFEAEDEAYRAWLASLSPEERAARDAETRSRASLTVSVIPGPDTVYDLSTLLAETDPITQEPITPNAKGWAFAGLFAPVSGKFIREAGGWALSTVGRWLGFDEVADAGARGFREGAQETVEEMTPRFRSAPEGTTGAENVANRLRLQRQLASEQQVGQLTSGGGQPFAGAGARVPIRDVDRLASQYGGAPGDWAKVRSSNFKAADGTSFEIHAYRNIRTGEVVELKTKFQ